MHTLIGKPAPAFTLPTPDKQTVSLSDYKGKKLVLLFFPAAFSGVCTAEMCAMRDDIAAYQNLDAQVLAISVDGPFTQGKFRELENLNFPLASDFNKEVAPAYGAFYDEWILGLKGVAKRSAFVIDEDGIVRYAEVMDSAGDLPNFEKVREALSQLSA
ncbi:MAG: peroxiredoxin [Saprospiraceae bacterium]|nr:peroxiredoxin [Saprospiraceae bacterium]